MAYTVYMVRQCDGSLYTGITTDIARRIREHNGERTGGARATRMKRPVTLAYAEVLPSRSEASRREYAIKHLAKARKEALALAWECARSG